MVAERLGRLKAQYGGSLVTTGTRLIDLPFRYGMHLLIALRLPLDQVGAFYIVFGTITFAAGLGRLGIDRALTREMAHEFGAHGIRVNAIAPGEIDTSILSPGTEEIVQRDIPMRRLGSAEEVAETILFLCSGAASYVNGAEIHINGGQHV